MTNINDHLSLGVLICFVEVLVKEYSYPLEHCTGFSSQGRAKLRVFHGVITTWKTRNLALP